MSWLNPKNMEGSGPEEWERMDKVKVDLFIQENGEKAGAVLDSFKEVDPLGVNVGGEAQYVGYAKKFWNKFKESENPTKEDIFNFVKGSFYESQLSNPVLLEPEKLDELIKKIQDLF